MPALNVPLIGESQSALHRRVAERNPGTWTPAEGEIEHPSLRPGRGHLRAADLGADVTARTP